MKKIIMALAAPLALAACDSATGGFDGPPALGIVSGNYQVVTAGSERLPDPVVGRMVRTPSGGIAFHLVTPAYANEGTVVQGSPIAGAVVCAVATAGELEPFTPCTNTDDHGQARFFFAPGTKAGEARAEIRGTLEGLPAVFDTVVAHVEPGAARSLDIQTTAFIALGDSADARSLIMGGRDQYGNAVEPVAITSADESEVTWFWRDGHGGAGTEPVSEGEGWWIHAPHQIDTDELTPFRREYVRDDWFDPRGSHFFANEYMIRGWVQIGEAHDYVGEIRVVYCLDGSPVEAHENGCPA